jgi:hypothetical protein
VYIYIWAGSSVGIATSYGLHGPGIESRLGVRFYAHVQTGPGAHPASCTMGTGSFPGVKRPECDADHTPPSKRRGHERVELYLYPACGPVQALTGLLYLYLLYLHMYRYRMLKVSFQKRADVFSGVCCCAHHRTHQVQCTEWIILILYIPSRCVYNIPSKKVKITV